MSGFTDMVAANNRNVFMNLHEFAEKRTVIYDAVTYEDIPIVLSGVKEKDRRQLVSDHAQGLYLVSAILSCMAEDMGSIKPEKGRPIKINDQEGGKFFIKYTVATSACELGMLRVGLEAIDE